MTNLILKLRMLYELRRARCREKRVFGRHLQTYRPARWHIIPLPTRPPSMTHYRVARSLLIFSGCCLSFVFFALTELLQATIPQQAFSGIFLIVVIYQSLYALNRAYTRQWAMYKALQ